MKRSRYEQFAIVTGDTAQSFSQKLNEEIYRLRDKDPVVEFSWTVFLLFACSARTSTRLLRKRARLISVSNGVNVNTLNSVAHTRPRPLVTSSTI